MSTITVKDGTTIYYKVVATKLTAATDAKWRNGFRKPQDFIGDVFQGFDVTTSESRAIRQLSFHAGASTSE